MRKFIVLAIIVMLIAFSACSAPVVNLANESAKKPTEEPTEKPTENQRRN